MEWERDDAAIAPQVTSSTTNRLRIGDEDEVHHPCAIRSEAFRSTHPVVGARKDMALACFMELETSPCVTREGAPSPPPPFLFTPPLHTLPAVTGAPDTVGGIRDFYPWARGVRVLLRPMFAFGSPLPSAHAGPTR